MPMGPPLRLLPAALLALAASGCLPPIVVDWGDDDDDEAFVDEGPTGLWSSPLPGEEDFFREDPLQIRFDRSPEGLDLSLLRGTTPLPGRVESSDDGTLWTFVPDAPLAPDTAYRFRIRWSALRDGSLDVDFRTGPWGLPLEDPEALRGATFAVDLAVGAWTSPPGLAPLVQAGLGDSIPLLTVLDESALGPDEQPGLLLRAGAGLVTDPVAGAVAPDPCATTSELSAVKPALFEDPELRLAPSPLRLPIGAPAAPLHGGRLVATVHPDGNDLRGGLLEGLLDLRPLVPLFQDLSSEDDGADPCGLLEDTIGAACVECGEPSPGPFCLPLRVERLRAWRVEGLPLPPRSCADLVAAWQADGSCAEQVARYDLDGDGAWEGCPGAAPGP